MRRALHAGLPYTPGPAPGAIDGRPSRCIFLLGTECALLQVWDRNRSDHPESRVGGNV
jgi:hypothetical protein